MGVIQLFLKGEKVLFMESGIVRNKFKGSNGEYVGRGPKLGQIASGTFTSPERKYRQFLFSFLKD